MIYVFCKFCDCEHPGIKFVRTKYAYGKVYGCKNKIFPRNILQFVSITFTRTSEKSYLFRILQNIYSCIPAIFPNSFKNKWAAPFIIIFSCKKWRKQKTCCVIRIIPAGALPLRLHFLPRAILFSCFKNTRT